MRLFNYPFWIICIVLILFSEASSVESILKLDQKWTGDFDGMVERHKIRVLTPYSKTFYFLDGAKQAGSRSRL